MTREETIDSVIEAIEALEYVTDVRRWTQYGKDRLYISTRSWNGGHSWNGGVGYRGMYLNIQTGGLVLGHEAGAKTRKRLEDTVVEIKRIREPLRALTSA